MLRTTSHFLTVGSLFSGVAGLENGFQAACSEHGIATRVVFQVEQAKYPRQVLARHYPYANRSITDVRQAGSATLPPVDALVFGFPCPDLSYNGKGAGLEGERSGLWSEGVRIVRELQPRLVLVENVTALLTRGLHRVLGDMASIGYNGIWQCISAKSVGFPHERDRIFIGFWREWYPIVRANDLAECECECCDDRWCDRCHTHYTECECPGPHSDRGDWDYEEEPWGLVAYSNRLRLEGRRSDWFKVPRSSIGPGLSGRVRAGSRRTNWQAEPGVLRGVDGVPDGVYLDERIPARLGAKRGDWEPERLIDVRGPDWKPRIMSMGNVVVPHAGREAGRMFIKEFLQ
jgi:hypothetical protein